MASRMALWGTSIIEVANRTETDINLPISKNKKGTTSNATSRI